MNQDLSGLILSGLPFISLLNLFLGLLVFYKDFRNRIHQIFFGLSISVALWGITLLPLLTQKIVFWARINFMAGALIACLFLFFSFYFPRTRKVSLTTKTILCFISGFFVIFSLTNLISRKFVPQQELGPIFPFYVLYIIGYMGWGLFNLISQYRISFPIEKRQILFVFFGCLITIILAVMTNLIFPFITGAPSLIQYGPYFTIFLIGFTTYAILKHHLFNIKVIATELFTAALLLLLFINIFSYNTFGQLILNIIIFIGALIFGIFLIRSVLQEVKMREQMQKLAKNLEEANLELQRLDKARTEFMSMASHQLRTPLTAIKGYISLALEGQYGKVSEKLKRPLKNVYLSNERLVRLVGELLTISRIEMGKLTAEKEVAQVEDLIQSCVEEMKITAEKKGLKLLFEKPKLSLPKVNIDSFKIRQVILNLIDNAIKYTQSGYVSITVNSKHKEGKIVIKVKDTGEGLTEEEKDTIFEGFTRGRAGTAFFIEGVGLGLYIAKKYLDLHQGKIWAESEGRGEGSTFYIELPIK